MCTQHVFCSHVPGFAAIWFSICLAICLVTVLGAGQPVTEPASPSDLELLADLRGTSVERQLRAMHLLAMGKRQPAAVILASMQLHGEHFSELRLYGPSVSQYAVDYLASAPTRKNALVVLGLFDPPDPEVPRRATALLQRPNLDAGARYAAELLVLAADPEATQQQVSLVAQRYLNQQTDAGEWAPLFTAFGVTRELGLAYARDGIRAGIEDLGRGDRSHFARAGLCMIAMCLGSPERNPADVTLLQQFSAACAKDPVISADLDIGFVLQWAQWRVSAGGQAQLEDILKNLGHLAREGSGLPGPIGTGFVDCVFTPERELPMLLGRASDNNAELLVRIGALELLGGFASADAKVQNLVIEWVRNGRTELCNAAIDAAMCCPWAYGDGKLGAAIRQRMRGETNLPLWARLQDLLHQVR